MSGLFSWATDTLASVKTSVMAPFRGDVSPARVEVHVHGKPPNPRKLAAKKRAQNKRKAAARQGRAADDAKATDEPAAEEELDAETKFILARMAEGAAARQREEEELAAAERERLRLREESLAHSCVRQMPPDPVEAERAETLTALRAAIAAIGCGREFTKLEDFLAALPGKTQAMDELIARIEEEVRTCAKKTPRPPSTYTTTAPAALRDAIQEEELKPEPNDLEIKSLHRALVGVISQQNQRAFSEACQELVAAIGAQRAKMMENLRALREDDSKQRAIERLVILYDSAGRDGDPRGGARLNPKAVVGKKLDIPVDFAKLAPFQRKIERKFLCVMTPPRQRQQPRVVQVWGHEASVDALTDWFSACDWTGRQTRTYDRRVAGLIVGRNGASIQQLETETDCLLNLDASNQLTVYGRPEDVARVWEKVGSLKAENARAQQVTKTVALDPRIGRALLALHRAKIQAIEDQYQCRVNIWLQPEEGEPRVFLRCGADKADEVFTVIKKSLVEGYCVLEFEGSARAISRMLVPQKMTGRASQINNEFKAFQQNLNLFVQRENVRGTSAGDAEAARQALLWAVCRAEDRDIVESTLAALLKKADYSTERISIMREQQRIFTAENRGLIEASSGGCRVSIINNPNEGTLLMLVGTDECIERGKQIVRDILEREGAVESVSLGDGAVVDYLLRDRAAVLRSMEDLHAVSIHVDREANTARIVGDRIAIESAAKELKEVEAEIARSQEDTMRLVITVDSDRVPMIIGRTGQTIQQIRDIPGIQSVDVPPQSVSQSSDVVDIVLVGRAPALEEAQAFIAAIANRPAAGAGAPRDDDRQLGQVDYGQRLGGRGRGRRPARPRSAAESPTTEAPRAGELQFEESAFPALGEPAAVGDA